MIFFTTRKGKIILSVLLLITIAGVTFLPKIFHFGFYWDDWFLSWVGHAQGSQGLITSLSYDRPFAGYLIAFNYSLFGDNPLLWNFYIIIVKTLSAIILLLVIVKLSRGNFYIGISCSLIFLIYPGFSQLPVALAYQVFVFVLFLWLLSIYFTVESLICLTNYKKNRSIIYLALSLMTGILSWLLLEITIGFEILRLIIIFYYFNNLVSSQKNQLIKIIRSIKASIPILATGLVFLCWRFFIFSNQRDDTDTSNISGLFSDGLRKGISALGLTFLKNIYNATLKVWYFPFKKRIFAESSNPYAVLIVLISIILLITIIWIFFSKKQLQSQKYNKISFKGKIILTLISIINLIASLTPVILTNRHIELVTSSDRYALTSSLSVAFLTICLIIIIPSKVTQKLLIVSLVSSAIFFHIYNSTTFEKSTTAENNYWWQLYWRAPQLQDQTVIMLNSNTMADYEIWGAANMLYDYQSKKLSLYGNRLDIVTRNKILLKESELSDVRNIQFIKDYNHALITIRPNSSSCLWILDNTKEEYPYDATSLIIGLARYSNIDRIISSSNTVNPPPLFGREPDHDWCYYFEKANLARQFENWADLQGIITQIELLDLKPIDKTEWLPIIEGYFILGENVKAQNKITNIYNPNDKKYSLKNHFCDMFNRLLLNQYPNVEPEVIMSLIKKFQC